MSKKIFNIGEGFSIIGIMLGVGLTENYYLLFFLVLPIWSWQKTNVEMNNKYYIKEYELKIEKLKQEIRILKKK